MAIPHDSVLLLAYGGPSTPDEVRPFIEGLVGGGPARTGRIEEAVQRYARIGGASPFNTLTFQQGRALDRRLAARGTPIPVYVGMRNGWPRVAEVMDRMAEDGRRRALAIVLAPHRSPVSWDRYERAVAEARTSLGDRAPEIDLAGPWHTHPGFVAALADGVRTVRDDLGPIRSAAAVVLFTAHAIPESAARGCRYVEEVHETASSVVARLGGGKHGVAFQSRAGPPSVPWTGPTVVEAIEDLARQDCTDVILSPIGFLCDHVEILYDLDVEAREAADAAGIRLARTETVGVHPAFTGALADLVEKGTGTLF